MTNSSSYEIAYKLDQYSDYIQTQSQSTGLLFHSNIIDKLQAKLP